MLDLRLKRFLSSSILIFGFFYSTLSLSYSQLIIKNFQQPSNMDDIQSLSPVDLAMDETSKSWYKFLDDLFIKLSKFEIQKDRSRYNVADIEHWGKLGKTQGIWINVFNFEKFLNKTSEYNLAEHGNIRNISVTPEHIEELNLVLEATLNYKKRIRCNKPFIVVEGNYILMKDIDIDSIVKYCNFTSDKEIQFINVFGLNTIFIDEDFSFSGLNMLMIAPKWQVIGTKKINLNNAEEESLSRSEADLHIDGGARDRKSGKARGQGGTFVGIAGTLIDSASLTIAANGQMGDSNRIDTVAFGNEEEPEASTSIKKLDIAKAINQFKYFLRQHFYGPNKKVLFQFIDQLDGEETIKNMYNTLGLVDELQSIEQQFHKLNDIDFLPFYQSLLKRINEYAENPKEVGDPYQYKKVLSYLYTATLGRVCNLKDNLESNLIVNIIAYLDSVKKDLNTLNNVNNTKNKVNIVKKYQKNYKKRIDIKIKKTPNIFNKAFITEIHHIGVKIDGKIESLINKSVNVQEKAKVESVDSVKNQRELEEYLLLKGLFVPLKMLSEIASFLGPVGTVVRSAIEVGSSVAQPFVLDNQLNTFQISQSLLDVETLKNQIKNIGDQKVISFRKTLEYLSQEASKHAKKLGSLLVKIAAIKESLNETNDDRLNIKMIQDFEEELLITLQMLDLQLKEAGEVVTDKETASALLAIDYLKKALKLSAVLHDTYSLYKNDEAKVERIIKAFENSENKFNELKEYKKSIYTLIAPLLKSILYHLEDIISKLGTKSKVAVHVAEWQIQNTLEKTISLIHDLTQKFELKGSLKHCIKKIKDVMVDLIDLYNYIQDYQESQELVNYISDVSSVAANDIYIVDEELRDATNYLDIVIRSNILSQRYQVAIDTFKQFVFPFARVQLKEVTLPSHFNSGGNNKTSLENSVNNAAVGIEAIKSKLREFKYSIPRYDHCIGVGDFSSKPFFTWKNEQHKNMISRLLSGKKVIVKSSVINSFRSFEAIKSEYIEWNFKAENASMQSEFDKIFQKYRVITTHLGDSYHQFGGKIYLVTTSSKKLLFSYDQKHNKYRIITSFTYDKTQKGEFMLSPYATWRIKLQNFVGGASFEDLKMFKNSISLELAGKGYYVFSRAFSDCLDIMVEKYYKPIKIYD